MLDFLFTDPLLFVVWVAALLTAITVHEFAHAWTADRLGDPTPRLQGRLTLNPLAHLDPIGTIMLLLVRFGWGRPVQFDPFNLKNPRRDAAIISLAGPVSNLILAVIFAIGVRMAGLTLLIPFVFLNVALAIFNLVPIHPLDGGKILIGLLGAKDARAADLFLNRYGMILLLFSILPIWGGTSLISIFVFPAVSFVINLLLPGLGPLA